MKQAYLFILVGVIFNRFNYYVSSFRIDLLPDFIGYLLTLTGVLRLNRFHHSKSYTYAKWILVLFLINELTNYWYLPFLFQNTILLLVVSVLLMLAQVILYYHLLQVYVQCTKDHRGLWYQRIYLSLALAAILFYLYLCVFGGAIILISLITIAETICLILAFLHIVLQSRIPSS